MSDINQVTKNLGIKLYDATDEPGLIAGYVTAMTILDEAASKAGIDQAARAMAAAADVKATTADGKAEAAAEAASIADGKATTAGTTAEAAATAAATADAKAVAADTKATQAIADAATADGKAVAADTKADTATTAAATADGKAVVADGKAEAAATAAATADAKAVAAQSRADAAYALAEAAGGGVDLRSLDVQQVFDILQPTTRIRHNYTTEGTQCFDLNDSYNKPTVGTVINYPGGHYHLVSFSVYMRYRGNSLTQDMYTLRAHSSDDFTNQLVWGSVDDFSWDAYNLHFYTNPSWDIVLTKRSAGTTIGLELALNVRGSVSNAKYYATVLNFTGMFYTEAETYYGTAIN